MGQLPCSKELLPITNHPSTLSPTPPVTVVGQLLLAQYAATGCSRTCIVTAPEKKDIQAYFGEQIGNMTLAYSYLDSPSTAHSIDACYAQTKNKYVLLGFPDIVLPVNNAFNVLISAWNDQPCDVLLGLFGTNHPSAVDMVRLDKTGNVTDIAIKQPQLPDSYIYTWSIALWSPKFTEYLHAQLLELYTHSASMDKELFVGDIITAAMDAGMSTRGVVVSTQPSLDIGTPRTYFATISEMSSDQ